MGRGESKPISFPAGIAFPKNSKTSIRLDFYYRNVRCRPKLKLTQTQANVNFAARKLESIKHAIAVGTFDYVREFPDCPRGRTFSSRGGPKLLRDAIADYLVRAKLKLKPSTWYGYNKAANQYWIPDHGGRALDAFTDAHITARMVEIKMAGRSNKRINNALIPLRRVYEFECEKDRTLPNPTLLLENLQVVSKEPDPFTPKEIVAVLAKAEPQEKNHFQFAFFTGLRPGEQIALVWSDVDWERGSVFVSRAKTMGVIGTPKTAAGKREVKLIPMALAALLDQKQYTYLAGKEIFHNPLHDAPWKNDHAVRTAWDRVMRRCKVRYRIPYQTRHTFASMQLSSGENPAWVARQMGHKDWGMLRKTYARWIPDFDANAGNRLAEKWKKISGE